MVDYSDFVNNRTLESKVSSFSSKFKGRSVNLDEFLSIINGMTARLVPNGAADSKATQLFYALDEDSSKGVSYDELSKYMNSAFGLDLSLCENKNIQYMVDQVQAVKEGKKTPDQVRTELENENRSKDGGVDPLLFMILLGKTLYDMEIPQKVWGSMKDLYNGLARND